MVRMRHEIGGLDTRNEFLPSKKSKWNNKKESYQELCGEIQCQAMRPRGLEKDITLQEGMKMEFVWRIPTLQQERKNMYTLEPDIKMSFNTLSNALTPL